MKLSDGSIEYDLVVFENVLTFGIGDLALFTVEENDYLALNGSTDGFYAQKNLSYDPYGYSKNLYALTYYGKNSAPEGSIPVKVKLA